MFYNFLSFDSFFYHLVRANILWRLKVNPGRGFFSQQIQTLWWACSKCTRNLGQDRFLYISKPLVWKSFRIFYNFLLKMHTKSRRRSLLLYQSLWFGKVLGFLKFLPFGQFPTIWTIAKTILKTCGIWGTDYNSDTWEAELKTITSDIGQHLQFWQHADAGGQRSVLDPSCSSNIPSRTVAFAQFCTVFQSIPSTTAAFAQ